MWYQFHDMEARGQPLHEYTDIYVEADSPEDAGRVIKEVLGTEAYGYHDGMPLYASAEDISLEQITAFDRGCRWNSEQRLYTEEPDASNPFAEYSTLDAYVAQDHVLVIDGDEARRILDA